MAINIKELRALPADEKLQLVELLWDEIHPSETTVPPWAMEEARRRLAELEQDPELGVSLESMRSRLANA